MEVKNCLIKTKCDILGCKNLAEYCVLNDKKIALNLCKNCTEKLHNALSKVLIPKPVTPPFKKQKKIEVKNG